LIAELSCVVQHKNETFSSGGTITCRLEMAGQMSVSLIRSLEKKR